MSVVWQERKFVALAVLAALCVFVFRLAWGVGGSDYDPSAQAQEPDAIEFACNENEQEVTTFSGSEDQSSESFEITGAEWRAILQATTTTQSSGDASINVLSNGEFTGSSANAFVDPEFEPTSVSDTGTLDGPGSFSLEAEANGASYEVLVCETGGTGGGGVAPSPSPDPPVQEEEQYESEGPGSLMESGGTEGGPVPVMPSGSCPPEYPEAQGGGCYR